MRPYFQYHSTALIFILKGRVGLDILFTAFTALKNGHLFVLYGVRPIWKRRFTCNNNPLFLCTLTKCWWSFVQHNPNGCIQALKYHTSDISNVCFYILDDSVCGKQKKRKWVFCLLRASLFSVWEVWSEDRKQSSKDEPDWSLLPSAAPCVAPSSFFPWCCCIPAIGSLL